MRVVCVDSENSNEEKCSSFTWMMLLCNLKKSVECWKLPALNTRSFACLGGRGVELPGSDTGWKLANDNPVDKTVYKSLLVFIFQRSQCSAKANCMTLCASDVIWQRLGNGNVQFETIVKLCLGFFFSTFHYFIFFAHKLHVCYTWWEGKWCISAMQVKHHDSVHTWEAI